MRICFLGNSHLAPIKQAWNGAERGDDTAAFAITWGRRLGADSSAELENPLDALLEASKTELSLGAFDAFAVVGLEFTVNRCARFFAGHKTWQAGRGRAGDDSFLASRECLLEGAEEQLRQSTAVRLARQLRDRTSAPIAIMAQGGMSERALETDLETARPWRYLCERKLEGEVLGIFDDACESIADDIAILPPPACTVSHEIMTLRAYDRWEQRGTGGNFPDVFYLSHTNLEYGRHALAALDEHFGATSMAQTKNGAAAPSGLA